MITDNNLKLNDEELEMVSGGKSKGEEYHGIPMDAYGLVLDVLDTDQHCLWIICTVEVEITGVRVQARIQRRYTIAPGRRVRIEPEGINTWRIVEVIN